MLRRKQMTTHSCERVGLAGAVPREAMSQCNCTLEGRSREAAPFLTVLHCLSGVWLRRSACIREQVGRCGMVMWIWCTLVDASTSTVTPRGRGDVQHRHQQGAGGRRAVVEFCAGPAAQRLPRRRGAVGCWLWLSAAEAEGRRWLYSLFGLPLASCGLWSWSWSSVFIFS
jgi:hypothetical protein